MFSESENGNGIKIAGIRLTPYSRSETYSKSRVELITLNRIPI